MSGLSFLLKTFDEEKKDKEGKVEGPDLRGILQRKRLKKKKNKKPYVTRPYFNPSTLTYGFCKRQKVAQLAGLVEIVATVPTPKEQLMFDFGHAIHNIIQGYFWDVNILEGEFKCLRCDHEWWDISPWQCPKCESPRRTKYGSFITYTEVPLKDEKRRISSRADGILNIEFEDKERKDLVDIKSIANKALTSGPNQICFEDLKEPKDFHVVQLNIYMYLAEIYHGHIFYVSKNSHQIKSFYVPYNEEIIKPYLQLIDEMIDWADKAKKGELPLPEPCDNAKCGCKSIEDKGGE